MKEAAEKELSEEEQKQFEEFLESRAVGFNTAMSNTLKEIMDGGVKK